LNEYNLIVSEVYSQENFIILQAITGFKGGAMHKLSRSYEKIDPDLAKCQTSGVGAVIPGTNREMYYCRIDNADCRYAMPVGFDYVCKHPESHAFLISEDADPEMSSLKRKGTGQ
jgi:hypothetical protein